MTLKALTDPCFGSDSEFPCSLVRGHEERETTTWDGHPPKQNVPLLIRWLGQQFLLAKADTVAAFVKQTSTLASLGSIIQPTTECFSRSKGEKQCLCVDIWQWKQGTSHSPCHDFKRLNLQPNFLAQFFSV